MKTIGLRTFESCLILAGSFVAPLAFADECTPATREVCVTGRAEVEVVPDQIVWEVFIKDVHKDLTTAKHNNDSRISALLDTVDKLGISKADVHTDAAGIEVQYDTDKDGNDKSVRSYLVTRSTTILERDLSKYDELFEALCVRARAEVSVNPHCSTLNELELTARKKAVDDARNKAEVMAAAAGAKIGKVLSISDNFRVAALESGPSGDFNLTGVVYTRPTPRLTDTFSAGASKFEFKAEVRWELTD